MGIVRSCRIVEAAALAGFLISMWTGGSMRPVRRVSVWIVACLAALIAGCSTPKFGSLPEATYELRSTSKYKIGPGDAVEIFV